MMYLPQRIMLTYERLKEREASLVRGLEDSCEKAEFERARVRNLVDNIENILHNLLNAKLDFENKDEISEALLGEVARPILAGSYEDHRRVRVSEKPDYAGIAETLLGRKDGVSCVVNAKGQIFNPRKIEIWQKFDFKAGEELDIYHHNMNGIDYSVLELINYVGVTVNGSMNRDTSEHKIETYKINTTHGLHARPATLLAMNMNALFEKTGKGLIAEIIIGNERVQMHSLLQLLTLGGTQGDTAIVIYPEATTKEQEILLTEAKKYNARLFSGQIEAEMKVKEEAEKKARQALLRRKF